MPTSFQTETLPETRAAVEAEICAWLRSNDAMGLSRRELAAAIKRGDYRPAIDRMTLGKQGD